MKSRFKIITYIISIFIITPQAFGYVLYKNTINYTSNLIENMIKKEGLVGVSIGLMEGDRLVWGQGFGYADKAKKIKATSDTVYMLGSGSKTLTTTALLKLYENKIIDIDNPVSTYLPSFKMLPRFKNQNKNLTVKHLLNHHSGLPGDIYNSAGVKKQWDRIDKNLYYKWLQGYLSNDYPSYAPGEIAVYCNTGFILASEILLRASKEKTTFDKYMKKNIFQPLGMKNSSFSQPNKNLAKGYIATKEVEAFQFNGIVGGTGGAFTTVPDMARFISMLLNKGRFPNSNKYFIHPQTVKLMGIAEKSSLDINSYFIPGLGFDSVCDPTLKYAGRTWIKDGSTGNFNSLMGLLPDKKLGVIILTNCDTGNYLKYKIMRRCLQAALFERFGLKPQKPRQTDFISIPETYIAAGIYAKGNGYDKIIEVDENKLTIIKNAHFPNKQSKQSNLTFSKNLNRFIVADSSEEIAFKTLRHDGKKYFCMIQLGSSNSMKDKYIYNNYLTEIVGQKVENYSIDNVWENRIGKRFIINNIAWNDTSWEHLTFELISKDNMLMVKYNDLYKIVVPQNRTAAFVAGLNNRSDSSIRFSDLNGFEHASYMGYEGILLENIEKVNINSSQSRRSEFHKTDWLSLSNTEKRNIKIAVKSKQGSYYIRVFDESLTKKITSGKNNIEFKAKITNYYIAISPAPNSDKNFTLTIN